MATHLKSELGHALCGESKGLRTINPFRVTCDACKLAFERLLVFDSKVRRGVLK